MYTLAPLGGWGGCLRVRCLHVRLWRVEERQKSAAGPIVPITRAWRFDARSTRAFAEVAANRPPRRGGRFNFGSHFPWEKAGLKT